jgi:hypothetical protein
MWMMGVLRKAASGNRKGDASKVHLFIFILLVLKQ